MSVEEAQAVYTVLVVEVDNSHVSEHRAIIAVNTGSAVISDDENYGEEGEEGYEDSMTEEIEQISSNLSQVVNISQK